MRRCILLLSFLLLFAKVSYGQTAVQGASHLGFDVPNQTPAVAQGLSYNAYVDSNAPVVLAGVTCSTGTPNTTCTATWPTMNTGTHTIQLTQVSGTSESAKSTPPFVFTFVVLVSPTNVRVVTP